MVIVPIQYIDWMVARDDPCCQATDHNAKKLDYDSFLNVFFFFLLLFPCTLIDLNGRCVLWVLLLIFGEDVIFCVDEEDNVTTWDSILLSNKISPGGGVAKVTFLAFDSSSAPIVTIHHLSTLKVCFCAFWAHALEQLLQKATTPFFSQNWWPRSPWGNTMWIMAQWQCPVASSVATDLLNQAMCTALHQHITMAIKMSSEGGIFQIYNVLYEYYKYKQKTMLWSLTTNGEP